MGKRKTRGTPWTLEMMQKRCVIDQENGCWLWQGAKCHGYGVVSVNKKTIRTHRLAYSILIGAMPDSKMDVCHKCDVRNCVNPDHLFLGTRKENMADCIKKGRFKPVPVMEGESSPNSKLSAEQVLSIRNDHRSGRELARQYGVEKGTIYSILKRKTWKSL